MTFVKNKEDFVCETCSTKVTGTGYTNHCPQCLWSKHVDVVPGDRAATCGGMMQPLRVEGTADSYTLVHRCEKCGTEKRNKVAPTDTMDALIELAASADSTHIAR
jgi:hypothetical protein